MIALADCRPGRIYTLRSRNLQLGVYDGHTGFIGLREKFGDRFLFTEYHWEVGPPHGTAHPISCVGEVDDAIPLAVSLGSIDHPSRREVEFDRTPTEESLYPGGPPRMKGWYFTDTGEFDRSIHPMMVSNHSLFALLAEMKGKLP